MRQRVLEIYRELKCVCTAITDVRTYDEAIIIRGIFFDKVCLNRLSYQKVLFFRIQCANAMVVGRKMEFNPYENSHAKTKAYKNIVGRKYER